MNSTSLPTTNQVLDIPDLPPRQRIYQALCILLSHRADQVDWASFSEADWQLLPVIAHSEGVAPAIYSILASEVPSSRLWEVPIPPKALSILEQEYYHNAAFNAMLFHELDGIQVALVRAGVPFILIKGAALAKTVYADPAERVMSDLDLLVRRDQLRPAVRALRSAGYRRLMDNYFRYHTFLLGQAPEQAALELHWSLVLNDRRYPALIDWFWSQSYPPVASEPSSRTLSPAAHLLYLAAHLVLQHADEKRLVWYHDLHRLVACQGKAIDWDALCQEAGQVSWSGPLHAALSGTQERFGSDLPGEFMKCLDGQAAGERAQASAPSITAPAGIRQAWRALDPPDRLRMLWGALFPSPAYLRWRYHPRPGWLWPLWYISRWRVLIFKNFTDL